MASGGRTLSEFNPPLDGFAVANALMAARGDSPRLAQRHQQNPVLLQPRQRARHQMTNILRLQETLLL